MTKWRQLSLYDVLYVDSFAGGGFFNVLYYKNDYMMQFKFSDIGKTVFLTKEEAEQALKGGERE